MLYEGLRENEPVLSLFRGAFRSSGLAGFVKGKRVSEIEQDVIFSFEEYCVPLMTQILNNLS